MASEPPAGNGEDQQQQTSWFDNIRKMLLMYFAFTMISNFFTKKDPELSSNAIENIIPNDTSAEVKLTPNIKSSSFIEIAKPEVEFKSINMTTLEKYTNEEGIELTREVNSTKLVPTYESIVYTNSLKEAKYYTPIWNPESPIDLEFYVDYSPEFIITDDAKPIVTLTNTTYDSKNNHLESFKLQIPNSVKYDNQSIYLHVLVKNALSSDVGIKSIQLNSFYPKKKQIKLRKLIGDDSKEEEVEELDEPQNGEVPIVSYWHPNTTISIVQQPGDINSETITPSLKDAFVLDPLNRRDNNTGLVVQYFPLIYPNKFWQLRTHMSEINSTVESLELNLNIEFSKFWKIQMLTVLNDGFNKQQTEGLGGGMPIDSSEIDSIKKILIETNPYLLAITIFVSLLHSVLEFLAFKNDISHWKNKKDNVGVSVRSIVANVIQQTITLLYLIDNSEGTSYMILFSQGIGILIEAWKITTVLKFEIDYNNGGIIPSIKVTDKHELTETEEKTKEYDSIAFKYLYWVSVPLLLAYAVYSMLYKEHKSWYSFIITTLVGFVYTYGFLTLVPAVYINYRLKSVAHIPKKAMAYKVVNTFIDDLFAFVIKMPWLHRLATLRDDIIFVIYLYQTWIYRVDYSRINEFGQGGEDAELIEDADGKSAGKKETKESKKKK